jgi:outer membrane protein insertion porin family
MRGYGLNGLVNRGMSQIFISLCSVCFRSELIVSDGRFSQVWLALLATTATLAVPPMSAAQATTAASSDRVSGTNGTQIRQSLATEISSVEPKAVEPKAVEPKAVESKAVEPDPIALAPEPIVVPVAPSAPIAASATQPAAPQTVAQFGQEQPNQIKITPEGPQNPSTPTAPPSTITAPPSAPLQVAPAPGKAPELPTLSPGTPIAPGTPGVPPSEARVLVGEVLVTGAGKRELEDEVYRVIKTRPGQLATRAQLQEDINAIFATGFFSTVQADPKDTPLGVRVTFQVQPNPVLKAVRVEGTTLVKQDAVDGIFQTQYGTTLNYRELQRGVEELSKRFKDQGYILAKVADLPKVGDDGVVTLQVEEGKVDRIRVRFYDKEGVERLTSDNKPKGTTREFIVTREMETRPGQAFNQETALRDLGRLTNLGIFEDVKISLDPAEDERNAIVNVNVIEKKGGSIAAGAGVSSSSGLFGTVSYQQQNLGGNNQKLGAEIQLGVRELLFDANFSDPWIAGDPYRTSYTVNAFRRRSLSLIYDGGDPVRVSTGTDADVPYIVRTGVGLSFARPLSKDVFKRSPWSGSLGFQYQSIRIQDGNGTLINPSAPQFRRDPVSGLYNIATGVNGDALSTSGTSKDDLLTVQLGFVRDLRNDALRPTSGSLLRFGTEQSIPVGNGSIFFNRLRGSYSQYIPTRLLKLSPGCQAKAQKPDCPQSFAFNIQAGTALGTLPPYEAFSLGGSNSIRGYEEGDVAAGKSFLQATLEYRFPVFSVISGALFVDAGTDFGTGKDIKGNPAGLRNKPGSGIGYGLGVRIQSPLGPIRIDYGFGDRGQSRFHFGIGERF